jgi:integrase
MAGSDWYNGDYVFATATGTAMDSANVRPDLRALLGHIDGLEPKEWTPRELRHSFVSLLSDGGVAIEEIARLAGHSSSRTTEVVYRKRLRPVLQTGATVMDQVFGAKVAAAVTD